MSTAPTAPDIAGRSDPTAGATLIRWLGAAGLAATLVLAPALAPATLTAQEVPSPEEVFGFVPGADYQLADYDMVLDYGRRLAARSPRVEITEIGRSAKGRPMVLLFISSEDNLRNLDRWKEISATLARARISEEAARSLASEGKAIVWIDAGMHATER
ncbi:MAG: hypothetical protein GWM92_01885, partial [Gemmatimonadetes bacterium]|nr:hypothetical protein [Gemmatimonadota bacterium]NIR79090.1 hypothetical protein [Gemmatimonadota bacterium]NIT85748.1 hypothetical protein [Gemmatimonadota bacterium]NIU31609.1 hypothetical protein [Gemmatimonadota bacterium]NIU36245.1 hypothetical protein [Gemmatimonadota bacterium]